MANFLYSKGIEKIGTSAINLDTDQIAVMCVATGSGAYVASQTADQSLADIPVNARIGNAAILNNTSFTNGVFDADDLDCPNAETSTVDALVLFKVAAGSPTDESQCWLIAYIDTASNLPYPAIGVSIPIYWSNGASRIFRING